MTGKQIQSAFKLAARMVGDGGSLSWDHIARYLEATKNFSLYIDRARGHTAPDDARMHMHRKEMEEDHNKSNVHNPDLSEEDSS